MLSILILAAGLALLVKGADWLVSGSSNVAARFGVSPLVIGLTVVAFGTSAPELAVSLIAAINGDAAIAIGNVVGSNTANILLILGACALIAPLSVRHSTVWKEIPFAFLAAAVLAIFGADVALDAAASDSLSRVESLALIGFFIVFLYYTFGSAKSSEVAPSASAAAEAPWKNPLLIAAGLAALVSGGYAVVEGASAIAAALGLSPRIIGLTVVAVGTSLPELATSLVATRRGETDIAIGNVVGSNIFNVFFILGLSGFISPMSFPSGSSFDLSVSVLASLLLFVALFVGRRHVLYRAEGVLFLTVYAVYTSLLFF